MSKTPLNDSSLVGLTTDQILARYPNLKPHSKKMMAEFGPIQSALKPLFISKKRGWYPAEKALIKHKIDVTKLETVVQFVINNGRSPFSIWWIYRDLMEADMRQGDFELFNRAKHF